MESKLGSEIWDITGNISDAGNVAPKILWIKDNEYENNQNNNQNKIIKNEVDSHSIPIPHFGVILNWDDWHGLSKKLNNKIEFDVKPHIRFAGKIGEQATMFFRDPDSNALEFKAFKNDSQIFEK